MDARASVAYRPFMTEPKTEAPPTWKFWHPLPFWWVLVIATGAMILSFAAFAALSFITGIGVPPWVGGGVGGVAMVVAVRGAAARRLAAK